MWPYVAGAVGGFFGVLMLSAGAHGPLAGGPILSAGQMILFHALALMVVAGQPRLKGGWGTAAMILFAVGSALFAGLIALRATTGIYQMAMLVPVGGVLTLAGWVVLAVAALRSRA